MEAPQRDRLPHGPHRTHDRHHRRWGRDPHGAAYALNLSGALLESGASLTILNDISLTSIALTIEESTWMVRSRQAVSAARQVSEARVVRHPRSSRPWISSANPSNSDR